MKFNSDGSFLATSSIDKTARIFRTNKTSSSEPLKCYTGHDDAHVSSVVWSGSKLRGCGNCLLTTTINGKGYMWSEGYLDPLFSFESFKLTKLSGLQFYFQDRFVLYSTSKTFGIVDYNIETVDPKIIKPSLNYNSIKHKKSFVFDNSPISSFTAANTYSSSLAFIATGRNINILDMNRLTPITSINNAHSRNIQHLIIADYGSENLCIAQNNTLGDILISSAMTDSIKCWDIRQPKQACIELLGHVNRFSQTKCSISPCGRYVASGSEDKQAYIYDIRKGLVLRKIKSGITDVVTAVDFHPRKARIALSSQNGKAQIFSL